MKALIKELPQDINHCLYADTAVAADVFFCTGGFPVGQGSWDGHRCACPETKTDPSFPSRRIRRPSMCSHRLLLPLLLLLLLTLPTQVDPQLGKAAETAIDALIKELPQDLVEQAQQYRVARANGKA